MRTWTRATATVYCGGPCGRLIAKDEPILVIGITGIPSRRRCQACAGEPVNWDAIVEAPQHEPAEARAFRPVAEMAHAFDPRMAAAGEEGE